MANFCPSSVSARILQVFPKDAGYLVVSPTAVHRLPYAYAVRAVR